MVITLVVKHCHGGVLSCMGGGKRLGVWGVGCVGLLCEELFELETID